MKKKIFSCKSVIHRSIPLDNLNYYNLIIFCLSICYYSFFRVVLLLRRKSSDGLTTIGPAYLSKTTFTPLQIFLRREVTKKG